jgi:4-amino-4-deoxy-L-arabinose transferase-like glycosyltransferase
MVFGIALMFDMLLTTCVLVGLIALAQAAATGRRRWHALFAAAIAFGILAKGPVIFLHLLPVALLAPLWLRPDAERGRWYRRTAGAVLGGILLAGFWVVPAALFGGDAYREKILWTQTAGRVTESFSHARGWWYYLVVFPLLTLPWFVWRRVWSGLRRVIGEGDPDCGSSSPGSCRHSSASA